MHTIQQTGMQCGCPETQHPTLAQCRTPALFLIQRQQGPRPCSPSPVRQSCFKKLPHTQTRALATHLPVWCFSSFRISSKVVGSCLALLYLLQIFRPNISSGISVYTSRLSNELNYPVMASIQESRPFPSRSLSTSPSSTFLDPSPSMSITSSSVIATGAVDSQGPALQLD